MSSCVPPCLFHKSVLVLIISCAASSAFQGQHGERSGSKQGLGNLEEEAGRRREAAWGDGRLLRRDVGLDSIAAGRKKFESSMITHSGMVTRAQPSAPIKDGSKVASDLSQPIMERVPEMSDKLSTSIASERIKKGTHVSKGAVREMTETPTEMDSRKYGHKKKKSKPDALRSANLHTSSPADSQGAEEMEGMCYLKVQGIKDELRNSGFDRELEKERTNPWSVLKFVGMQAKKRSEDRSKFTICQTGFNYGVSAAAFLCMVPSSRLISWDLGKHEFLEKALAITYDRFAKRHTYIKGNSTETLREAVRKANAMHGTEFDQQHKCDFVFIDGGHDEGTLMSDITNFAKISSIGAPVVMNACNKYSGAKKHETEQKVFREAVERGLIKEEEDLTRTFDTTNTGVCGGKYL